MVPPGWKTVSPAFLNLPKAISDSEWTVAVEKFTDDISLANNSSLLVNGLVLINPSIIFDKFNKLSAVHCAYICCSKDNSKLKRIVSILISHGVRCFSVYVGCTECTPSECLTLLTACCSNPAVRCHFTLWCELHCADTYDFFSTDVANQSHTNDASESGASFSIGLLVPRVFFDFMSAGCNWKLLSSAVSEGINALHGQAYTDAYVAAGAEKEVSVKDVLALMTHASVASANKYIIHLRDGAFCMRPNAEGAECVWSKGVSGITFANHLGEVPMLCEEGFVLQFAAFVNMERLTKKQLSIANSCNAAYEILAAYLKCIVADNPLWRDELNFAQVSLATAVGIVGLAESIGGTAVNAEDIESTILPLHRSSHTIFPLRGALAAAMWCVSPGCWNSHVPFSFFVNESGALTVPSGGFARYLRRQRVSLEDMKKDELHNLGIEYARREALKRVEYSLETPVESQLHELRKVCSSFFSPSSMRIVLTHQDGVHLNSISSLVVFLSHIIISNAKNHCSVLLPEIYSCDVEHAIAVNATVSASSVVKNVTRAVLGTKRKQNQKVSDAVSGFLQGLLHGVRSARSQAPLPSFALKTLRLLANLKDNGA